MGLEAIHVIGELSPGMFDMIWLPLSGFEECNKKSNKYSGKAGVLSGGYATDITSSQSKLQPASSCFIVFWIGQKHWWCAAPERVRQKCMMREKTSFTIFYPNYSKIRRTRLELVHALVFLGCLCSFETMGGDIVGVRMVSKSKR